MGSSSISSETGIKHVWIDAEVGEIQMKRYPYVASSIVFLNSIWSTINREKKRPLFGWNILFLLQHNCWKEAEEDDIFREEANSQEEAEVNKQKTADPDKIPFSSLQVEDSLRRPSVTAYQLEDPDHPDVQSIQRLVSNMNFGEPWPE